MNTITFLDSTPISPLDLGIIFIYNIILLGLTVSRDGFSWPSVCVP